jgi:anti-sigma regulatory factor (Ser/Thr protein kinase)
LLAPAYQSIRLTISDESGVGQARRAGAVLASAVELTEAAAGRLALIITEAGTNQVRHGGGGEVLLRPLRRPDGVGIEVLALDRGPGMDDVFRCLQDGYSSGGTTGVGLGGIRRLATDFDIHSEKGRGTAILARVIQRRESGPPDRLEVGAVCVAIQGEELCGDAWSAVHDGNRSLLMVADGLGHGPLAAEASQKALPVLEIHKRESPLNIMGLLHRALRGTRGAAIGLAEIDHAAATVRFAGVGNISGLVSSNGTGQNLTSFNGIVGHNIDRLHDFSYAWPEESLLILYSDGLGSRWSLEDEPALRRRDPALLAGILYRDFNRGRDDVTVMVAHRALAGRTRA